MRPIIVTVCLLLSQARVYPQPYYPQTYYQGGPIWSSDETQLVFQIPDGIYTVRSSGEGLRKVTSGGNPSWASDGKIVFADTGGYYSVNTDGSQRVLLYAGGFSISPDGKNVLIEEQDGFDQVIKSVNTENKVVTTLFAIHDNNRLGGFLVWSPDSKKIAYKFANGQGTQTPWWIVMQPGNVYITVGISGSFYWTPDSSHLLYTRRGNDGSIASYISDINTIEEKLLVENGFSPALSPDGTRIAFYQNASTYTYDIYVRNIEGTESVKLVEDLDQVCELSWSPDGAMIAFVSYSQDDFSIPRLHILDVNGGKSITTVENLSWGKTKSLFR